MSESEKVINIITVGDQTKNKPIFVELFDYHSIVKTFKWPIENKVCRVNAIRQLQFNGEWLDNDKVKPGNIIACLNYELVGFNNRYNVIDYSQRLNVRPSKIFRHCIGPQDTLNVLIMSVDCRKFPLTFYLSRCKEFENVMTRVLPCNSAVIFIRDFHEEEMQPAIFKSELSCHTRADSHFVFADLNLIDDKMAAEEAFNRNRAEFNRLIAYLDRLSPVSLEYVKNIAEQNVPLAQNTSSPEIIFKPKPVLGRYVRPVCLVSVAVAVSIFLVCGYKIFFYKYPVPSFKIADTFIRS